MRGTNKNNFQALHRRWSSCAALASLASWRANLKMDLCVLRMNASIQTSQRLTQDAPSATGVGTASTSDAAPSPPTLTASSLWTENSSTSPTPTTPSPPDPYSQFRMCRCPQVYQSHGGELASLRVGTILGICSGTGKHDATGLEGLDWWLHPPSRPCARIWHQLTCTT